MISGETRKRMTQAAVGGVGRLRRDEIWCDKAGSVRWAAEASEPN